MAQLRSISAQLRSISAAKRTFFTANRVLSSDGRKPTFFTPVGNQEGLNRTFFSRAMSSLAPSDGQEPVGRRKVTWHALLVGAATIAVVGSTTVVFSSNHPISDDDSDDAMYYGGKGKADVDDDYELTETALHNAFSSAELAKAAAGAATVDADGAARALTRLQKSANPEARHAVRVAERHATAAKQAAAVAAHAANLAESQARRAALLAGAVARNVAVVMEAAGEAETAYQRARIAADEASSAHSKILQLWSKCG